jgi:acetylglutamate/LysW-gamma-L-alpha-aminoadipate kinase
VSATVTVVKCGGNAGVDQEQVCKDVAILAEQGEQVVLAHGGSDEIERLSAKLGVPQQILTSPSGFQSRYSTAETIEALLLALAGRVKPDLLVRLARRGVSAVGLTGLDGGLLRAERKPVRKAMIDGKAVVIRDDLSGRIVGVNVRLLRTLLDAGLLPVVSPPALADGGTVVNVDADRAAAAVAVALGAGSLVLLTSAPGVLRDLDDDTSVVPELQLSATDPTAVRADGGMGLKLIAAREALLGGVGTVLIADGRGPDPVSRARDGIGTTVRLAPTSPEEVA